MKALILCAGYATRLYPLTQNQPKHLLPIGGKPMLNHLVERICEVKEIDEIYLVTNNKFYNHFKEWIPTLGIDKKIEVFNDGTLNEDTRLGAIGDMKFVIDNAKINDDLMVVAGDNLFNLNLIEFVDYFKQKGIVIGVYDVKDKELMKKYGEVQLDQNDKVISFREKPQDPKTTFAAICLYLFPKSKLNLIEQYLKEGNNPDQPGRYIQWLYQHENVYGYVFDEQWYDIGDLNQYKEADKLFCCCSRR